jgi:hypothetical protein
MEVTESHCIFHSSKSQTANWKESLMSVVFAVTINSLLLSVKIYAQQFRAVLVFCNCILKLTCTVKESYFFPKILNKPAVQAVPHSLSHRKQVTSYLGYNKLM